ncbi:glycoside hydrolase family 2, partial [candidate division KSB1 bacterium]|nr:glycoside hydrolase family 2 [candidate division KSB1 bacterium]
MKLPSILNIVAVLLFSFCIHCHANNSQNARIVENFNNDWKFHKGDVKGAEEMGFDDTNWRTLDLPHDWSIEGPYSPELASCTGYLPGGIAWYRKTIDVPNAYKDKAVYIYFEGIYRDGEVFINGHSLGIRPNGYISYYYNLSPFIKFGEKNTIAVRVDHSKSADSRWYTGSGIYRDVHLVYANPVHIENWGIYLSTPAVTNAQAVASIQTSVKNTTKKQASVEIVHELFDKDCNIISKSEKELSIPASDVSVLTQELEINEPNLWSIDNPYLYKLKTSIYQKKKLLDSSVENVGIRTLGFDANKGFSLNGKSMKVKGVCLHHDSGVLGAAVYREVWERRLKSLKSLGCNAIRTSHNPRSPILYELCDELGLLVLNEAFDEWEFPKKKWLEGWNVGTPGFQGHAEFFEEWAETDLRDMVLRDRNHPSV